MDADYVTDVEVRYRDLDPNDHVNNAVYATYLEQARSEYFAEVVERDLNKVGTVLATLNIDYHRAIELDDEVTVGLSVPEMGTSSLHMEYEIHTDDGLAATASTVQVAWDREKGESRPIPDDWRGKIAAARND